MCELLKCQDNFSSPFTKRGIQIGDFINTVSFFRINHFSANPTFRHDNVLLKSNTTIVVYRCQALFFNYERNIFK